MYQIAPEMLNQMFKQRAFQEAVNAIAPGQGHPRLRSFEEIERQRAKADELADAHEKGERADAHRRIFEAATKAHLANAEILMDLLRSVAADARPGTMALTAGQIKYLAKWAMAQYAAVDLLRGKEKEIERAVRNAHLTSAFEMRLRLRDEGASMGPDEVLTLEREARANYAAAGSDLTKGSSLDTYIDASVARAFLGNVNVLLDHLDRMERSRMDAILARKRQIERLLRHERLREMPEEIPAADIETAKKAAGNCVTNTHIKAAITMRRTLRDTTLATMTGAQKKTAASFDADKIDRFEEEIRAHYRMIGYSTSFRSELGGDLRKEFTAARMARAVRLQQEIDRRERRGLGEDDPGTKALDAELRRHAKAIASMQEHEAFETEVRVEITLAAMNCPGEAGMVIKPELPYEADARGNYGQSEFLPKRQARAGTLARLRQYFKTVKEGSQPSP